LYKNYSLVSDVKTDLQDFINTGFIADDNEKFKVKQLRSADYKQFLRRLREASSLPLVKGFGEICNKAAALYEEKSMPAEAVDCMIYALAGASKEEAIKNYEDISRLLKKIGNQNLASGILNKIPF
jgi:hypothetical protein